MPNLQETLTRLEHKLQGLFEGSLARLFPNAAPPPSLAARLVDSLNAEMTTDEGGAFHAPANLRLFAEPQTADFYRLNPGVLSELVHQLNEAAREAEITFDNPLLLQVFADPALGPSDLRLQFAADEPRQTTTAVLPAFPPPRRDLPAPRAFLIVEGREIHNLTLPVTNLGRRADNQIFIDDLRVSRQHAQIRSSRGRYTLFDLQSTGGTFVNGQRIHQVTLKPGDVISLAGVLIVFGVESPTEPGKTEEYRPNRSETTAGL